MLGADRIRRTEEVRFLVAQVQYRLRCFGVWNSTPLLGRCLLGTTSSSVEQHELSDLAGPCQIKSQPRQDEPPSACILAENPQKQMASRYGRARHRRRTL